MTSHMMGLHRMGLRRFTVVDTDGLPRERWVTDLHSAKRHALAAGIDRPGWRLVDHLGRTVVQWPEEAPF